MAHNSTHAFFQKKGTWPMKWGAALNWGAEPIRLSLGAARIEANKADISPAEYNEIVRDRKELEDQAAARAQQLNDLREKLEIGAPPPAKIMDALQDELNAHLNMEDHCKDKFAAMTNKMETWKRNAENQEAIAIARQQIIEEKNSTVEGLRREVRLLEENKNLLQENNLLRQSPRGQNESTTLARHVVLLEALQLLAKEHPSSPDEEHQMLLQLIDNFKTATALADDLQSRLEELQSRASHQLKSAMNLAEDSTKRLVRVSTDYRGYISKVKVQNKDRDERWSVITQDLQALLGMIIDHSRGIATPIPKLLFAERYPE